MPTTTVRTPTDPPTGAARRKNRRREIYEARRRVWAVTSLKRVRLCGWAPRSDEGVTIRVSECEGLRRAGVGNVQTCGSFWACPVCSEKIAAERQAQIQRVLRWWTADEHRDMFNRPRRVVLVTLTVRHRRHNSLRNVWDTVSDAWRKGAVAGADWKADQDRYGMMQARTIKTGKSAGQVVHAPRIRTVRVVEVTHGRNGWHVHIHALLLVSPEVDAAAANAIAAGMFARWSRVVKGRGLGTPTLRHGVDARVIAGDTAALGDYFVKAAFSASHEVSGGMRKEARKGNRTPFGVLADLMRHGEADDLDTWEEWERVSKGRRAIAFSPGLLTEAAVDDLTDEEIVEADQDGEVVATILGTAWAQIRRHDGICDLLEAFEDSTPAGLAMLTAWQSFAEPLRA